MLIMKNLTLLFIICLLAIPYAGNGQCGKRQFYGKAGITFSAFGDNTVIRFTELAGTGSYDGTGFHSLGINYVVSLNRWIDSETGLEYSKHNLLVSPAPSPEIDHDPVEASLSLITIPLSLRANFLRYFFFNGGMMLGLDASAGNLAGSPVDSQTGIGALLGIGVRYDFRSGAAVFFNPYTRFHSLLPFSAGNYHQRAVENGFRFGIAWDLEKL